MTGRSLTPGSLFCSFLPPRGCNRPVKGNGKSSCIPTGSGGQAPSKSACKSSHTPTPGPRGRPTVAAKELLAESLAKVLRTLQQQIREYRRRIGEAFRAHRDHDIFGSLPGAKEILAPRLLAELGSVREEYPDFEPLQCMAGASPVSYQSGQIDQCRLRRACNKVLPLWVTPAAPRVNGPRHTTNANEKKARATLRRCAAWASDG